MAENKKVALDFNDGLGVLPISKGGTGVTSASEVLNVVGGIPANAKKCS